MTPPADGAVRARRRPGRAAAAGVTFGLYLLLACVAFWPVAPLSAGHLPGCACSDPAQQTWFIAWASFALRHGQNPLVTGYLNVPGGANLAIDTSMPLLGAAGMPVTLLAGPVATFNLLLRLGLALSAMSMFAVLRRYTHWWPAAFGGGLLYGFSAYMAGQAERHLFLVFVPLIPLFLPLLDDWLVSLRRPPARSGLLVGLVAGLEYLISPEIALASALMAAAGLAYLALRYREEARQRLMVLARGLAPAAAAFLVIAGYPAWMLLAGPGRPAGPLHTLADLTRYHGDLLAPFVPTSNQALAPHTLVSTGNSLVGGRKVENGFYLGIPLAVLLCYLTVRCRRIPVVAVAAVVGGTAFVLSLGTSLTLRGKVIFLVMPFALFGHVPLLQDMEAARLSLFLQLAAALIFGIGLGHVRAKGWWAGPGERAPARPPAGPPPAVPAPPVRGAGTLAATARPVAVAALGLVVLAPVVPRLPFTSRPVTTPAFFTGPAVRMIPPGSIALTFPYDRAPHNEAMMWQAASGMRFRIIGGDAFVPGPGGRSTWQPNPAGPEVLPRILRAGDDVDPGPPPTGRRAVAALRQLLTRYRVDVVLVDPSALYGPAVARLMHRTLGVPPRHAGGVDVWVGVQKYLHKHTDSKT